MAYPRSKKSFACKSWKSTSVICLVLVSLLAVPNLSWSAQPTVRMSQPITSLGFLSIYAARANGYFNDEGIALELILVQGGADIAAIISGSVDLVPPVQGACLELSPAGRSSWEFITFSEGASTTWLFEKIRRGGWVSLPRCLSKKD